MEKAPGADDLKGLEEEIDSAVDRLFVEEKKGLVESLPVKSSLAEPSLELETPYDVVSAPSLEKEEPLVLDKPILEKPFLEKPSVAPPSLTPLRNIEEDLFCREAFALLESDFARKGCLWGCGVQDLEQDLFEEKPSSPCLDARPRRRADPGGKRPRGGTGPVCERSLHVLPLFQRLSPTRWRRLRRSCSPWNGRLRTRGSKRPRKRLSSCAGIGAASPRSSPFRNGWRRCSIPC